MILQMAEDLLVLVRLPVSRRTVSESRQGLRIVFVADDHLDAVTGTPQPRYWDPAREG